MNDVIELPLAGDVELVLDRRPLRLTSLDKVYWPRTGHTKGDALRYYASVAPVLLPHIAGRPLTLGRYPHGVEGRNWFQTTCPHPPPWITTHPVTDLAGRRTRDYCIVDDVAGLLWVTNLGGIELHPLLGRTRTVETPTAIVFDLDPGAGMGLIDSCAVSLWLRDELDHHGLLAFPKLSGGLGLHVVVPLNTQATYSQTKAFARALAESIALRHPGRVIAEPQHDRRQGKIFVDWAQNNEHRSLIAPYSLRAMPWPVTAAPLSWDDVEWVVAGGNIRTLPLDPGLLVARLEEVGDIHAPVLEIQQVVPSTP